MLPARHDDDDDIHTYAHTHGNIELYIYFNKFEYIIDDSALTLISKQLTSTSFLKSPGAKSAGAVEYTDCTSAEE